MLPPVSSFPSEFLLTLEGRGSFRKSIIDEIIPNLELTIPKIPRDPPDFSKSSLPSLSILELWNR